MLFFFFPQKVLKEEFYINLFSLLCMLHVTPIHRHLTRFHHCVVSCILTEHPDRMWSGFLEPQQGNVKNLVYARASPPSKSFAIHHTLTILHPVPKIFSYTL
jgi:hypothetical protein